MKIQTVKYFILITLGVALMIYLTVRTAPEKNYVTFEGKFLSDYFSTNPVTATWIGTHDYDGNLPRNSKKDIADRIASLTAFAKEAQKVANSRLDRTSRVNIEIIQHDINKELFSWRSLKEYQWNPLFYVGTLGFAFESLAGYDFTSADGRLQSLISRLAETPRFIAEAEANLESMPIPHLETAVSQIDGLIHVVEGGFPDLTNAGSDDLQGKFKETFPAALAALKEFRVFLESRLENGPHRSFRIGETLYREKLAYTLNEKLTAEDVLSRAEAELRFMQGEMIELAEPLYRQWYGDAPVLSSHKEALRMVSRVLDRIADDHAEREDVVQNVEATIQELNEFIESRNLLPLDKSKPLEIRLTPEYQRGINIASLQAPGPLEKNLSTFYNVSPIPDAWTDAEAESFLREYNRISVKMLSIHEALPGHYVQLYYANRHPSVIRAIFSSGVMVEGWAHYAEGMMVKAGFGDGDPRYALTEKKWKLRGIVNAIIDQKIHAGDMTEKEAMDLMTREAFQETSEARAKWRRAQLTSTQLSTYFVGNSLMWDLRHDVEEKLGTDFDLKGYHEELLSFGSLPIRYLREEMLTGL